jgi:hypothetical protein
LGFEINQSLSLKSKLKKILEKFWEKQF